MIIDLDCYLFAYAKLNAKMLYVNREFTVGFPGLTVVTVYRPVAKGNEWKAKE